MTLGRRRFMKSAGTVAAALAALRSLKPGDARAQNPWGPLDDDPFLALPPGFSFVILQQRGGANDPMTDGYAVPTRADGMECWMHPTLPDHYVLMCNHENSTSGGAYDDDGPPEAYSTTRRGGVTRIVVDNSGAIPQVVENNLVLTGTERNCAGGWSPWGWLSCEETTINGHGYVFLCDTEATSVQAPDRKDVYGRFNHEAAVVDPNTHICYLTEDSFSSGLYRFVPDSFDEPFGAGKFQALKHAAQNDFDTDTMSQDQVIAVEWIDIDNNDLPWGEASSKGAAIFRRGEGIAQDRETGWVYACCTQGDKIFCLDDNPDSPTLTLIGSNELSGEMNSPDNIIVSPWGDVWFAEDTTGEIIVGFIDSENGAICEFARNTISEFAGVCFSPDGKAMFVNIQGADATLMVTGPFPEIGGDGDGDGDGDGGDGDGGDGDGDGTGTGGDGDGTAGDEGGESGTDSGGSADDETGGADAGADGEGGSSGGGGGCAVDENAGGAATLAAAAAVVAARIASDSPDLNEEE